MFIFCGFVVNWEIESLNLTRRVRRERPQRPKCQLPETPKCMKRMELNTIRSVLYVV